MNELTVGNARITYRTEGSGPPLVLVHGVGPGSAMWDGVLDRLTGRNTVHLPDLSGSDTAVDDGSPLTIEALAEQVIAVLDVAGPADVFGFSLGAPTAAAVAALRPDLVRRLIVAGGFAHADDVYLQEMVRTWLSIADSPEGFERFGTLLSLSRPFLNETGIDAVDGLHGFMHPTDGRLRQLDLVRRVDVRPLLPSIEARTLVIGFTRDTTVPVENHRELSRSIKGSEYAELDAGHAATVERPDEFLKLVHDFLDRP